MDIEEAVIGKANNVVDEIKIDISYEILEHFSENMYSSPNKAIEELVTNGFDAAATRVDVYLPSEFTPDRVLVWDNGYSMNKDELKKLWIISDSPKRHLEDRTIDTRSGGKRKIIGKFGIGKLASYIVGKRISHLCRIDDDFFLVEVDYPTVTKELLDKQPYRTPIRELTRDEALELTKSYFNTLPSNFADFFEEESWTLAVVSDLKRNDLYPGRLRWVLGHAMPLRPDFEVYVNSERVLSKLEKTGARKEWDFGDEELIRIVKENFSEDGGGQVASGKEAGLSPKAPEEETPYLAIPSLGKIWGTVRFFEQNLMREEDEDRERSHGFFIMVRDRLINEGDALVLLGDPNFGIFYRSQFILHIDSLDQDLLADRERFKVGTQRAKALKKLQQALMLLTRQEWTRWSKEEAEEINPANILPIRSREHFFVPMTSLWRHKDHDADARLEVKNPRVEAVALEESKPISTLAEDGSGFQVNTSHPYFRKLQDKAGGGRRGAERRRQYEALAVTETLLEGFLLDRGLKPTEIAAIMEWRDGMLRQLAKVSRTTTEQLAEQLRNASYKGDAEFEEAIAACLTHVGFKTVRDGSSGKKDGLVKALAGPGSYTLTFEAKGTNARNKNTGKEVPTSVEKARVSNADTHRRHARAEHAIIVARKFAGFEREEKEGPMVLEECITAGRRVSLLEVNALVRLMHAVDEYLYPLEIIKPILTKVEAPSAKLQAIESLVHPLDHFDYRRLLDSVSQDMDVKYRGRPVPWRSIFYDRDEYSVEFAETIAEEMKGEGDEWPGNEEVMSETEKRFEIKLLALARLAPGYFIFENGEVYLKQSPERIMDVIAKALE